MSDKSSESFSYDWSRFTQRIDVKSTPGQAYAHWATRKGIEKWFLRDAIFTSAEGKPRDPADAIQKGDKYEWTWHGYDDSMLERGEVTDANGKDRFQFTFGKAGNVTVTITEEMGTLIVSLLQEKIPTDEYSKVYFHVGCTKGWVFYLANLKSILEGGLDLRNKNVALQEMLNA